MLLACLSMKKSNVVYVSSCLFVLQSPEQLHLDPALSNGWDRKWSSCLCLSTVISIKWKSSTCCCPKYTLHWYARSIQTIWTTKKMALWERISNRNRDMQNQQIIFSCITLLFLEKKFLFFLALRALYDYSLFIEKIILSIY